MLIPQLEYDILRELVSGAGRPPTIEALSAAVGRDQSPVTAACLSLQNRGWVRIEQHPYQEVALGEEGRAWLNRELPERVIIRILAEHGGRCAIAEIPKLGPLDAVQVGQSLRWLRERGWADKQGDVLVLTQRGRSDLDREQPDELLMRQLAAEPLALVAPAAAAELAGRLPLKTVTPEQQVGLALLQKRRGFVTIRDRVLRTVQLTEAGRAAWQTGLTPRRRVTRLTPELLTEGAWREVELEPYDVTLPAARLYPGKEHPFQRTLDRVRRVFLEMGFVEVSSPWVESSFWDFDALYQPQDHPARDMQDTFYVKRPQRCRLPEEELVDRVRQVHENGWETGSTGWQYRWSRELACKPVLRTHTTAATIRALARHAREGGEAPGKYFAVGPVYRRETADYKHLPVFHQVDGIIVDAQANLVTLLGTLRVFYEKMGFSGVEIRPSFFPYTEPSAEVLVYLERRGEWIEMGGSGVFRPEVTLPLGIRQRVLAWGLGLERLAMLIHGLESIGQLYFATMPWLREEPLVRA